jgi:AcrR family transcriptional regulator
VLNAYGQDVGPDGLTAAARGAATRERILREAFVLIGEVGWSRVTTRLLARRAGVNAALINYHFRSKDSLLREAAAAGIAELVGPAIERVVNAVDAGGAVADVLRFLAGELTPAQGRSFLELSMRALDDAEVGRLMTVQLRAFRSLLAGRIARSDVDRVGLAVILVGLLDGVLLQRTIDPETDVEAAAHALEQLLRAPDAINEEGT